MGPTEDRPLVVLHGPGIDSTKEVAEDAGLTGFLLCKLRLGFIEVCPGGQANLAGLRGVKGKLLVHVGERFQGTEESETKTNCRLAGSCMA